MKEWKYENINLPFTNLILVPVDIATNLYRIIVLWDEGGM